MRGILCAALCLVLWAGALQAACRQALVLALDVSGSVNDTEYGQQVAGLAAALNDPDVRDLILSSTEAPIALAAFEWSSRNHQTMILPWVSLTDAATLDAAIARLAAHRPTRAGLKTAMGQALAYGAGLLDAQQDCWSRTIDVSGDGRNNIGPTPRDAQRLPQLAGITINALVVGPSDAASDGTSRPSLSHDILRDYFEAEVIAGPNAFAIVAFGYADYARAMRLKLLRELALPTLGALPQDQASWE